MKYPLIASLIAFAHCGDHHDDEAAFDDGCAEPAYGGAATDEAWKTMVDAYDAAEVGSPEAVTVQAPGSAIDAAATTLTLTWTSPIAAGPVRPRALALAAPASTDVESSWFDDALDAVGGFFVGSAHAHLPPITGDIYFVELTVAGTTCPIARGLTTDEQWTLSAADWSTLKSHIGLPISVTVTSAYLTENRVTEGPYRPAAPTVIELQ